MRRVSQVSCLLAANELGAQLAHPGPRVIGWSHWSQRRTVHANFDDVHNRALIGLAVQNASERCSGGFRQRGQTRAVRWSLVFREGLEFEELARGAIERSIPALLDEQVERHPDRPAVWTKARQFAFCELKAAAAGVSGAVLRHGAAPDKPVAILLEQGCDLVAAILGTLAAGRFYVPLDPRYSSAWLRRVVRHSEASLILCNGASEAAAHELAEGAAVLRFHTCTANGGGESPAPPVGPDSWAYLYYTSGSTGEPKGVLDNHRNVIHNIRRYVNGLKIGPGDRLTLLQSPGFSGAVSSMFSSLAAGACLYPFDPRRASRAELARWAIEAGVTIWHSTPSLFRLLCSSGETFPDIRVVRLEGDQASPADFALFRERFAANSVLVNGLGTTETGLVRRFFLAPESGWSGRVLPVGYAVEDMDVHVVSEDGTPVIDQAGEIAVTSRYLALGYWRQPELTVARFRRVAQDSGVRTYFTGDLGRMSDDGCLEILGRKDDRLKIRGQWTSVSEIEAELAVVPGVSECVVIVADGRHGESRLIAYFTSSDPMAPTASTLRRRLAEKLPSHLTPSMFVQLDSLPLSDNGKVNRQALPPVPQSRPALDTPFCPPETVQERQLANAWRQTLELDEIGLDDDFFELGGDSLDAMRLAAALGIAAEDLLKRTTIRRLAEHLAASKAKAAAESDSVQARIERLSPAKRALLEKPLHGEPQAARTRGTIPRAAPRPEYPLSFTQRRLWFFEQLTPNTSTYNVRSSFRIRGPLDVGALEAALQRLVERQAALRTTFHDTESGPVQRVHQSWRFELERITLDAGASSLERDAFLRLRREEAAPFDLTTEPPFRAAVIRIGDEDCLLMLLMHHIVSDGWSLNILSRELAELYNAHRADRADRLPDLPIAYVDHALWEIEQSNLPEAQADIDYWVRLLEGAPATLPLLLDRPRTARPAPAAGETVFGIPEHARRGLQQLCARRKATPFMGYLAAWAAVLHRHGAGEDIVVGVPMSGRTRSEAANLIGFFVNTLGFRIRLSGEDSFAELLERVREIVLDAMKRPDAPFEKIVERLNPLRRINSTPVFQTSLAYLSLPYDRLELEGVSCEHLPINVGETHFDTTLSIDEGAGGVRGRLAFRSDIFDQSTGDRFVERFLRILDAAQAQPDAALSRLPMASEEERSLMLGAWNRTEKPFPRETIHRLFERVARRVPELTAIREDGKDFSYGDLDERSERIAGALRAAGVARGSIVGLLMGRSASLIAAMLGVLKAGGAYMPLDGAEPAERLREMLAQAQPAAVLAEAGDAGKLDGAGAVIVPFEGAISHPPIERRAAEGSGPADAAYVLFTSGSTGRPKAVITPHQAVVRLLFGIDYVELSDQETLLHMAPPPFDASTFEIWGALLHGGRCVVLPQRRPSLHEIGEAIRRNSVSTAWLTSSFFNTVIDEAPEMLSGLRQLLIGGEALSVLHVRRALDLLPKTRIVNGYGPTECTTFACCYTIPRDLPAQLSSIPIGRPIANTEAYVLDSNLEPAPIGVPGELYLGGPGLALGYRNDPELTAARFVAHPFRKEPGAQLYRTGDSARFLSDGLLEFLGREDGQVKVRGFRIELGEIEFHLRRHEAVAQAAAVAREDRSGAKQILAYVTPRPGAETDAVDFDAYLRSKLPDYMIPSRVVAVEALPRTSSGKVDRAALPAPPGFASHHLAAEPADAVEAKLVAIWKDVLGSKDAGPLHDFFDLGGHSLLATRLITRIERELGKTLPIAALFEAPTPRGMAAVLRRKGRRDG